jgi:subtilisin-like proprotein convertase family protein
VPGSASATLSVPAGSGAIDRLAVTVSLTHTYVGDLVFTVSNETTAVTLVHRPGVPTVSTTGYPDNYNGTYTFVDSAPAGVWEAVTGSTGHDVASGSYHPSGPAGPGLPSPSLAAFAHQPMDGQWTLTITDHAGIDTGNLLGFSIRSLSALTCPPGCGSADFNCDGDVGTDADIEGFFACIAGACPEPPCLNSADFNGDGDVGTDADIEAFFRVLGGGPC